MDATYLGELRALNEINFARFDSKLEQRIAELGGETRAAIEALRGDTNVHIATLRGEMVVGFEGLRKEIAQANVVALRWFIALTITSLFSVVAAVLGLIPIG